MRPTIVPSILDLTKQIISRAVSPGGLVVDGTLGNGHDTLFLAGLVGEQGMVFGFDVQADAVEATRVRLAAAGMASRARLFHAGHETVARCLPPGAYGHVQAAMFNLGYLPGGDREIITRAESTIFALEALLPMLHPHGVISVHVYTGHEGGTAEGDAVLTWAEGQLWDAVRVARYDFVNKQRNGEVLLIMERLGA